MWLLTKGILHIVTTQQSNLGKYKHSSLHMTLQPFNMAAGMRRHIPVTTAVKGFDSNCVLSNCLCARTLLVCVSQRKKGKWKNIFMWSLSLRGVLSINSVEESSEVYRIDTGKKKTQIERSYGHIIIILILTRTIL